MLYLVCPKPLSFREAVKSTVLDLLGSEVKSTCQVVSQLEVDLNAIKRILKLKDARTTRLYHVNLELTNCLKEFEIKSNVNPSIQISDYFSGNPSASEDWKARAPTLESEVNLLQTNVTALQNGSHVVSNNSGTLKGQIDSVSIGGFVFHDMDDVDK